jgi:glycosyltransferase involved in cell wall biosynthesis
VRILHVIGNTATGGAERHLLDLVGGQVRRGSEVHVIAPGPAPLVAELEARGVTVSCIDLVRPLPNDSYGLLPLALEALATRLRSEPPDVVHSHLHPAHLHATLAAAQAQVPVIVHTAHTMVSRPVDALLARLTRVHTIAVSEAVRRSLLEAGAPAERITVILNGIDLDRVRRSREAAGSRSSGHPALGTVCRLSQEKGLDVLLRAFSELRPHMPGLQLVIAGDGPERQELERLAAELGIEDCAQFVGVRGAIGELLAGLDLFVLSSRQEACPLALMEAMAAGCAVVATDVGGVREVVTHGEDGWLVEPERPSELAAAMRRALEDSASASRLGQAARRTAATHFTLDRMVDETLSLYEMLLSHDGVAALRRGIRPAALSAALEGSPARPRTHLR